MNFFKKMLLKKYFSNFLDKESISLLSNVDCNDELKDSYVGVIVMQFDDKCYSNLKNEIELALNVIDANSGFVSFVLSSIVVSTFGLYGKEDDNIDAVCTKTGECLLLRCNKNIKIIYGEVKCKYGNISSDKYSNYSLLLPGFNDMLANLFSMKYGEMRRIG